MKAVPSTGRQLLGQDATVFNIQALRAFAAMSVAYFHLSSSAGIELPFPRGTFGVDIFFVISGYVISYISSRDSADFMLKRLIRILPAYWTATIATFMLFALLPFVFRSDRPNLELLIASFLFVPHFLGARPVLSLGWTLDFEMYFYVIFAASLAMSLRYSRFICIALIVLIGAAAHQAAHSIPVLAFYGDAIVLEFVLGVVLFEVQRRLATIGHPNRPELVILVIASLLALSILVIQPPDAGAYRILLAGVPAALLVGCAIILESRYGLVARHPVLLFLGDASYVLYLIHPFVLYAFTRLLFRGAIHWPLVPKVILAVCLLAITAAIAVAIHIWLEKPVLTALRKRLVGRYSLARQTAAGTGVP